MENVRHTILAAVVFAIVVSGRAATQGNESGVLSGRDADPVVILGEKLPQLQGLPVDKIVGFRFAGGWWQIPIQIDERKYVDFGTVYNEGLQGCGTTAYTDPTTYVGPDSDPDFDADDELVFMAKDAGQQVVWYAGPPTGVIDADALEIEVRDPLTGDSGYIYLFETDGFLRPDAGADYVTYRFDLLSGPYRSTYHLQKGPNPENSYAYTKWYRTHFTDRFACDELNILAGGATGADILDRNRSIRDTGGCDRSEDTFNSEEGAFFTNKDGPVRAIRSYMGCNSGPRAQREHLFYERRHDVTWYWRCHALESGIMDLYDYSPEAVGMQYYDLLNLHGALVDGQPDVVLLGPIDWQMLTGDQGTLIVAFSVLTDIPGFSWSNYYSDDATPQLRQCTGDMYEYGLSGFHRPATLVNTDPKSGSFKNLTIRRMVYFEEPHQTVEKADERYAQATTSLEVSGPIARHLATDRAQPLAHWMLDETEGLIAHDSAGPYFGRLHGDPLWQPASGRVGGALELDGIDDHVIFDSVLNPASGPFSVFAWIKGGIPGQVVISQIGGADWLCANLSDGKLMTGLIPFAGGRTTPAPLGSESVITDGQWHHVGFVWSGSYRSLYVDGVEVATDAAPQAALTSANDGLYIGAGKAMEAGTFWSGLIDDVRIYNRAVRP